MIAILLLLSFQQLIGAEVSLDPCNAVYCGSGICIATQNPTLPYYCRCQNGSNTILPCPSEDPCTRNPCGQGTCEVVPNLLYGYVCRCPDDTVSLNSCNNTRDVCASNPCINGLCIEGLSGFICNCLPSWTGRLCDMRAEPSCPVNLCDSGKCFPINDPAFPFVCLCPDGEFATSCTADTFVSTTAHVPTTTTSTLAPSNSLPEVCNPMNHEGCFNGGQCLTAVTGYRCLCLAGYTGRHCETKVDACSSYPCLYGGICYNLQSSYICACPDGSFRSQCLPAAGNFVSGFCRLRHRTSGACLDDLVGISTTTADARVCPCRNGGMCAEINSEACTCSSGFTGRFCENVLYNSCREVQCHNGGTCLENSTDSTSTNYCRCKNGFTGQFCEIEYFQCRANGRFTDQYNCANGKYFECVHYYEDGSKPGGQLLSRNCPASLRYNAQSDVCDYPKNVQC